MRTAALGPLGRLAAWCVDHLRLVAVAWGVLFVALAALAPSTEHALSGAGWEASGSESVRARQAIEARFPGHGTYSLTVVVTSRRHRVGDAPFAATLERATAALERAREVGRVLPAASAPDGRTVVLRAAAAAEPAAMVRAAGEVGPRLERLAAPGMEVAVTGLPGLWSDINETSKEAMLEAELKSWPLTLAVLVVAFGSVVAAGLPLMLAILGLVASIGALWLFAQGGEITIWAVNFSLMFALAVGIDYALILVVRFRAELRAGLPPREAAAVTMDTSGKAVLLSGLAVIASLGGLLLIASPPFRTTPIGISLAVALVLAASLTLLPGVLARLGPRIDRVALPWRGAVAHRSEAFARWAELVWRRPALLGGLALAVLAALLVPLLSIETAMPDRQAVPEGSPARAGEARVAAAFGAGASSRIDVLAPAGGAEEAARALRAAPGIAGVATLARDGERTLIGAVPAGGGIAAREAVGAVRAGLEPGVLVGGAAAETHDLERMLADRTPLLYAFVLVVGFALLVVAVRAPVIAAAAVLLNLLATGAAFGVATLLFQHGVGAGLLGFEPQGFVTAWGPVFFFTLIFALAMDYTVFLLASIKERLDRGAGAREATIEGMAASGRVINAAAAVMVLVFFTFALSEPLPPKELGLVLGVAVLLDATLIRLLLLPVVLRILGERAWHRPLALTRSGGLARHARA